VIFPKIVTFVRLVQRSNAISPRLVTFSGIVTLASSVQMLNARSPMFVTLAGMITLVNLVCNSNEFASILVTGYPPNLGGMTMEPDIESATAGCPPKSSTYPTDALPPETVYVHVKPFTVAVSATDCGTRQNSKAKTVRRGKNDLMGFMMVLQGGMGLNQTKSAFPNPCPSRRP
jgi:hypothetical protein